MKRLFWLLFSLWTGSSFLIGLASSGLAYPQCGASLEFRSDSEFYTDFTLYDFNTGVSLVRKRRLSDAHLSSPDEHYRYDIPWYTGNDNDVFLIDTETETRDLIYSSPFITSVVWAHDSRALLIWEFDGTRGQSIVTRLDVESGEVIFRHELPPTLGRRRTTSPDNSYIFAQFPLDVMRFTQGVLFVDTVTGNITRFEEPTEFPYLWSEDGSWVASQFQDMINIINPITGNFYPNFPEPIMGEDFIWQGDNLWFTRSNRDNFGTVWKANLADGTIDLMINDARLSILNVDVGWATIFDRASDDVALYNLTTGRRYPLNIAGTLATERHLVAFSANGQCAALLLTANQNQAMHELRIIHLGINRLTHQQLLKGDINTMRWFSARSENE